MNTIISLLLTPKLKILKGVPSHLADKKQLLKPVSVFYVLKSLFKTGVILNYSSKIEILAQLSHCSQRTFYTRLNELKRLKLITIFPNRIELTSYKKMHQRIGVSIVHEKYHYKKAETKPEYILKVLAIKENFDKQETRIKKEIKRRHKGSGLSSEDITKKKEADFERLIVSFKFSFPIPENNPILYQPDVAINQLSLARMYGLKSQASGYYWQAVLENEKLIHVENRKIESKKRCRVSPLGTVFYSSKTRKTYCQLPNKILFL